MKATAAAVMLLVPMTAQAHLSMTPRAFTHGATQKYAIMIPTEGKVNTTGAEIEFPGFLRHSFAANTVIMTAGFMLVGYQLAGYFAA
jgi:uncharacterized protein YcnI